MSGKNIAITIILTAALFIIFKKMLGNYISKKLDGTGGKMAPAENVTEPSKAELPANMSAPATDSSSITNTDNSNAYTSNIVADPALVKMAAPANNNFAAKQDTTMIVQNDSYINDMPYLVPATIFQLFDVKRDQNVKTITTVEA